MVPRVDISAIAADTPLDEVVRLIQAEAHSRYPVYRESLDDVIGMIHVKDLLAYLGREPEFKLDNVMRKVLFVAPSMRVLDLLLEMRKTRLHMALVCRPSSTATADATSRRACCASSGRSAPGFRLVASDLEPI